AWLLEPAAEAIGAAAELGGDEMLDRPRWEYLPDSPSGQEIPAGSLVDRAAEAGPRRQALLADRRAKELVAPLALNSDQAVTDAERQLLRAVRTLGGSSAAHQYGGSEGLVQALLALLAQSAAPSCGATPLLSELCGLIEDASPHAYSDASRRGLERPSEQQGLSVQLMLVQARQFAEPIAARRLSETDRLMDAIQGLEQRLA